MKRQHRDPAPCARVLCAPRLLATVGAALYLTLWPLAAAAADSPTPSAPPRSAPPQAAPENTNPPAPQPSAASAPARGDAEDGGQPLLTPGFTRIGVLPLQDESTVRGGAEKLTAMLEDRLGARFESVEFVVLDPQTAAIDGDPALPDNARELGRQFDVQALLAGVFGGIEIAGGTWPNRGSDMPEARGMLRWRLIDCQSGRLAAEGDIAPRKPKVYSQRLRSEESLIRSVMQGLVAEVGDTLKNDGLLAGVPAPVQASPAVKSKVPGGRQ